MIDTPIERANTSSMKWDKYPSDVIPMWVADMDLPVAEPIMEAMRQRLAHPIVGYTRTPDSTRAAVAAQLERDFGWKIDPEWLVFVAGVVPALSASIRAWTPPGEAVMVNTPLYHHFLHIAQDLGREMIDVPLVHDEGLRYRFDLDAMRASVTPQTRLLMLCSPHNPVGRSWRRDELEALCQFAEEHDLLIISDEIHAGLTLVGEHCCIAPLTAPERVITISSASKTFNVAGENASFAVISDPAMRAQFQSACQGIVSMVSPLAFAACEAAYTDGEPWRQELLGLLRQHYARIERAVQNWPGVQLAPLEATYLAWLKVDDVELGGDGADDVFAACERAGVGPSPGAQFGDARFIRLNFACPSAQLEEVLRRLDTVFS